MILGINELKKGSLIVVEKEPYRVLHVKHSHMGRGSAVVQAKVKSLITGKLFNKSFKPSDELEEAEVGRQDAEFIYSKNGEYWFFEAGNPSARFCIEEDAIGEQAHFLKSKMEVKAFRFNGEIINIELPIKAEYKVTDAPPNVKGNTAQGGAKQVTIEGGKKISTPMFIETGDVIRVNTDTGEYVERA